MYGVALCIFLIGVEMAQKSQNIVLVIASVVIGSIIGEMLDIQEKLNAFGAWVEKKLLGDRGQTSGSFGRGFISASLIFCIGAMAIVGSIEEGLTGNRQILFAKAMLDGILSIIFAANMGAGVGLSAVPVGLYQGTITLLASWMQNLLTPEIIRGFCRSVWLIRYPLCRLPWCWQSCFCSVLLKDVSIFSVNKDTETDINVTVSLLKA